MGSNNSTSASIAVATVIETCVSCCASIHAKRKKFFDKAVQHEFSRRRLFGQTITLERAAEIVNFDNEYHKIYAWGALDTAERVLKLARATHALEMQVSSHDWEMIA